MWLARPRLHWARHHARVPLLRRTCAGPGRRVAGAAPVGPVLTPIPYKDTTSWISAVTIPVIVQGSAPKSLRIDKVAIGSLEVFRREVLEAV